MPKLKDDHKTETIFNATLRLVLKTGFSGLKMADVAKEAGLAIGTLYLYFKNKEDLVNQLYLHLKRAKMRGLAVREAKPDESFFIRFKQLWYHYVEESYREPERMIFIEQYYRSGILTAETKAESDAMLLPLVRFMEEGIGAYFIKPLPAAILLSQIMGAANELIKLHIDHQLPLGDKEKEAYFEMAWGSIRR